MLNIEVFSVWFKIQQITSTKGTVLRCIKKENLLWAVKNKVFYNFTLNSPPGGSFRRRSWAGVVLWHLPEPRQGLRSAPVVGCPMSLHWGVWETQTSQAPRRWCVGQRALAWGLEVHERSHGRPVWPEGFPSEPQLQNRTTWLTLLWEDGVTWCTLKQWGILVRGGVCEHWSVDKPTLGLIQLAPGLVAAYLPQQARPV